MNEPKIEPLYGGRRATDRSRETALPRILTIGVTGEENMSERRSEILTASMFAAVTLAVATFVAVRMILVAVDLLEAAVLAALGIVALGTIAWALFHHEVTIGVFRGRPEPLTPEGPASGPEFRVVQALNRRWTSGPRWLLPGVGALVLFLLFVSYAVGFLGA
jgi:hypothetical protein